MEVFFIPDMLYLLDQISSQALSLVKSEPEKAITPYIQLVKFEKYIQQQSSDNEKHKDLSAHLKKTQIRLGEELDQVLSEYVYFIFIYSEISIKS